MRETNRISTTNVQRAVLAMVTAIACLLVGCAAQRTTGCTHDADCGNAQVCKDGECTDACAGVQCGPGEICVEGRCTSCEADCAGRECGPDPVCGASCGECDSGEVCTIEGVCTGCLPDCTGRECGPDPVCNVLCGACDPGNACNPQGRCEACVPDCSGLACGPDPACGVSCGACVQGQVCEEGACVCLPHASRACHQDDVWWIDSCGQPEERIAVCENGCDAGQCQDCTADCAGRECGPDPQCGTSCGTCAPAEACSQQGQCEPPAVESYDVVVVGAGSGGVAVAIQAARLGMHVALVEETDWIGGQMTSASVGCMDDANRRNEWGVYAEFIGRVEAHYQQEGRSFLTCRFGNEHASVEPSVGKAILEDMLSGHPGIDLFLRTRITAVHSETVGGRTRVTGVSGQRFSDGATLPIRFQAAVTVDATEYGDLLPLSPARYRAGNSTSDAVDPDACVQDITYVAVIRKYPNGVPEDLRLDSPPPGYSPALAASFAENFANQGNYAWGSWPPKPWRWKAFLAYRGLPDSSNPVSYTAAQPENITRTSINIQRNDFPCGVDALQDRDVRKSVHCEAKLRTLQVLYYIRHDLGRTDWSIADDEGYDSPYNVEENSCGGSLAGFEALERNMPPMPYARESHRVIGMKTLTASEARRVNGIAVTNFPASMAVGVYGFDLHACKDESDLEGGLESWDDLTHGNGTGWFQVPFGTLVPEQVDGFLAAEKNLSVTRIVNGAIRLQPITMHTGQAAGALAALAVDLDLQPRHVPLVLVQDVLAHADCRLALEVHTDVPPSSPYWPSVQLTAPHRIMKGYPNGTFGAANDVTRKIGAVVLARLFGLDTSDPPDVPSFTDVPASHPHYAYIEAIKAAGLTNGCGNGRFCPDDPMTRSQAAVFVVRGLGLNPADASPTPVFTDVGSGHGRFGYIQLVGEHELIEPCSDSPPAFCPDDSMTRGELAMMAARSLVYMARTGL